MLISEEYKKLQTEFHQSRSDYGISGGKWADKISHLANSMKTREVLDYGCGRQHLQKGIPWPITNYDPCIPGLDEHPDPHDLVACTDVLEHIEPECLDDVLDDLCRLAKRLLFASVATGPARKFLPDGRNAHLIQEGQAWWLPKFMERFELQSFQNFGHEFVVLCTPKEKQ